MEKQNSKRKMHKFLSRGNGKLEPVTNSPTRFGVKHSPEWTTLWLIRGDSLWRIRNKLGDQVFHLECSSFARKISENNSRSCFPWPFCYLPIRINMQRGKTWGTESFNWTGVKFSRGGSDDRALRKWNWNPHASAKWWCGTLKCNFQSNWNDSSLVRWAVWW